MSKTFSLVCTLLSALFSFHFVNGAFITSNAGRCSLHTFWYEPLRECVPFGKRSSEGVPPDGITCPVQGNWYWSHQRLACLPTTPMSEASASCLAHYAWDAATSRCVRAEHGHRAELTACGATEFWFPARATCLARRDARLPSSSRCPSGWYWNPGLAGCAPAQPEALASLAVICPRGSVWSPLVLTCQRSASPSRRAPPGTRSGQPRPSSSPRPSAGPKSHTSRSVSLCPVGLDPCPILKPGDLSDYECIDPIYDLQHCGGCSMDGRGQDCTAIRGVWNVECIQARCSVLTCAAGYVPSIDRRTCIKL